LHGHSELGIKASSFRISGTSDPTWLIQYPSESAVVLQSDDFVRILISIHDQQVIEYADGARKHQNKVLLLNTIRGQSDLTAAAQHALEANLLFKYDN
jgi:hypothetical protein